MAKFDYRKLSSDERKELLRELATALAKTKTTEDMIQFLEQLLTPSEVAMLGRRWQIAKRLVQDKSYYVIQQELKVGISTIQSVDQWLRHAVGDYRTLGAKLPKTSVGKKIKRARGKDEYWSYAHRRRPFPPQFVLLNLLFG